MNPIRLLKRVAALTGLLVMLLFTAAHAQTYKIATYNMRYDNPGDSLNPWKERLPVIMQMIRFYDFDVFGGQELLHHQVEGLSAGLTEYAYVGIGRDDGRQKGEYSPVFYKKDKFKLIQSGTFWLSSTPETAGSRGWDAALPRVCSWAQLEDRQNGFRFYYFNTHFDHRGVEARKESARLIVKMIGKIAGQAPVVLNGDFNFDQLSESYAFLKESFRDAFDVAKIKMPLNGTANRFDITSVTEKRIDHIFINPGFDVTRYGILTNSYRGKFPSDHFPVMAEVTAISRK